MSKEGRSLEWFDSLTRRDFDNQAVLNEIRDVFKQRDQLREIISGEPRPKESKRAAIARRRQDGGHWG